jgi:phosphopantothenoylcysteine synthetase/decarboxylase
MKQKIIATLMILSISFIALADNNDVVTATPSLSSFIGFIISGIMALTILLIIILASPNKEVDYD